MKNKFIWFIFFLFIVSYNYQINAIFQAYPKGYAYLKLPVASFFSPEDIEFIQTGKIPASPEKSKNEIIIYKKFIDLLQDKNYFEAEEILLKNTENPLNLLNLSLLYLYLEANESATSVFYKWANSATPQSIFRLIEISSGRRLSSYLSFLVEKLTQKSFKYYADFLWAASENARAYENKRLVVWQDDILEAQNLTTENIRLKQLYILARTKRAFRDKNYTEVSIWISKLSGEYIQQELQPALSYFIFLSTGEKENAEFILNTAVNDFNANKTLDIYSHYVDFLIEKEKWEDLKVFMENNSQNINLNKDRIVSLIPADEKKETEKFDKPVLKIKIK
ncbi:MAG: hypothetical protein OEZ22_12785 [Spirochaetia bacterium]|nr:hypothetical protein [Spirochaetia bacterium]